jgi:CHASE3 domain sensor protein
MPSQRIILGIGLAILLIIGAASIGLDLMSRSDTASVDRALGILSKISDMRPLLRRSESAARAFAITGDQQFAREYRDASDTILPALAALIEAVKDNPTERQLIEEANALVERQIALNGELIRFRITGDDAAVAALVGQEDRAATAAIAGNLEKAVAEERRLLAPAIAGFPERHPGHQRSAGGRSRRAHRASGRRP